MWLSDMDESFNVRYFRRHEAGGILLDMALCTSFSPSIDHTSIVLVPSLENIPFKISSTLRDRHCKLTRQMILHQKHPLVCQHGLVYHGRCTYLQSEPQTVDCVSLG